MATNYSMSPERLEQYAKHGESWFAYPDDKPLHSLALKGDSRAALVPFFAHRSVCPLCFATEVLHFSGMCSAHSMLASMKLLLQKY